jgi:hypothetical protein
LPLPPAALRLARGAMDVGKTKDSVIKCECA